MFKRSDALDRARNSFWLARQPLGFQDAVCAAARVVSVARGEYLFHVGDAADEFFFVAEGVLITTGPHAVLGAVVGQVNHPGQWFGEPAALSMRPRMGSVLARRSSVVVAVGHAAMMDCLQHHPQFATSLFELMANNTEEHATHGLDLLIQVPKQRLCARLLTLAGRRLRQPAPLSISLPLSQEELALTSCLSRQTVNQILGELVDEGLCTLHYGEIRLLDTGGLAKLVT